VSTALEVCVCGFEAAPFEGPRHVYFNATAACWATYGEVLAREFSTPALLPIHQLSVDTYAAQHPGGSHPDKSIAIHLVGLYLVLDRQVPTIEMPRRHKYLADAERDWPHFEPPARLGPIRASDVASATSPEAHAAAVRAWARSVWTAWSEHHPAIKEFAFLTGVTRVEMAGGMPSRGPGQQGRRPPI
jgi:hypothetical protein